MVRRIVKPFAVEIRNSGPRVRTDPVGTSAFAPAEPEQPHITGWPGLDRESAGSSSLIETAPESVVPTGRILPALDQAPATEPSVKPRRRRPPAEPAPFEDSEDVSEPMSEVQPAQAALTVNVKAEAATSLRKGRTRLPRDAFDRSERWKARLPAAVHGAGKRRGR